MTHGRRDGATAEAPMMGTGFGAEIGRMMTAVVITIALLAIGIGFGAGYGCRACSYRPHFEMRKVTP